MVTRLDAPSPAAGALTGALARCRGIGDSSQFRGTFQPGDQRLILGLYGRGTRVACHIRAARYVRAMTDVTGRM